jgi:hypothetical protein
VVSTSYASGVDWGPSYAYGPASYPVGPAVLSSEAALYHQFSSFALEHRITHLESEVRDIKDDISAIRELLEQQLRRGQMSQTTAPVVGMAPPVGGMAPLVQAIAVPATVGGMAAPLQAVAVQPAAPGIVIQAPAQAVPSPAAGPSIVIQAPAQAALGPAAGPSIVIQAPAQAAPGQAPQAAFVILSPHPLYLMLGPQGQNQGQSTGQPSSGSGAVPSPPPTMSPGPRS